MFMASHFGNSLRELRLRAGFGLRRFALLVDVLPSNLSAMEHGRRSPPTDPEKLQEMADVLGLLKGSEEWSMFFDAARRAGQLPADVAHLGQHKLVPVLLRAIDNRNLSDAEIQQLVADIEGRQGPAKESL